MKNFLLTLGLIIVIGLFFFGVYMLGSFFISCLLLQAGIYINTWGVACLGVAFIIIKKFISMI